MLQAGGPLLEMERQLNGENEVEILNKLNENGKIQYTAYVTLSKSCEYVLNSYYDGLLPSIELRAHVINGSLSGSVKFDLFDWHHKDAEFTRHAKLLEAVLT